jgi:Glycosyl hydrolase family 3 C-terminal domain
MMPSSYRRSRLLEPASLIPWSDPGSPSFPNPSKRRSFARPSTSSPLMGSTLNDQNRMLDELLGINPTTVVVMKDSNPVLMPWIEKAPAVLQAWNQGTEDGHVVADLLFGVVNPSGKVPTSYPWSEDDTLYAGKPERYRARTKATATR